MSYRVILKWASIILIFQSILLLAPLVILGSAINWPSSLGDPAHINLPLVSENLIAVSIGYSIYLLYSILIWPMAYFTGRCIVGDDISNPLFRIANGFAIVSMLTRCLGIVRWLFVMPYLSSVYINSETSEASRETIEILYEMLNAYAGGIGEYLGVSLFNAIWLALISILLIRSKTWPSSLGYFGLLVSCLFITTLIEIAGVDAWFLTTLVLTLFQTWLLVAALVFWNTRGQLMVEQKT